MVPKFIMNSGELVSPAACASSPVPLQLLPSVLSTYLTCMYSIQLAMLLTSHICTPTLQVRILVHTDVTKYLEFKGVDGSFVLNKGRVEKVPATDYEALRSPLLGLFEKRRLRSFLLCALNSVDPQNFNRHAAALSCLTKIDARIVTSGNATGMPCTLHNSPDKAPGLLRCTQQGEGLTRPVL